MPNDKHIPHKLFFRPLDIAILFDVSIKTIYSWVDTGKLDAVRIGGRTLRIPYRSLIKFIKDND